MVNIQGLEGTLNNIFLLCGLIEKQVHFSVNKLYYIVTVTLFTIKIIRWQFCKSHKLLNRKDSNIGTTEAWRVIDLSLENE